MPTRPGSKWLNCLDSLRLLSVRRASLVGLAQSTGCQVAVRTCCALLQLMQDVRWVLKLLLHLVVISRLHPSMYVPGAKDPGYCFLTAQEVLLMFVMVPSLHDRLWDYVSTSFVQLCICSISL